MKEGVVRLMPYSFKVVNKCLMQYKELESYTIPKSYLELIKLFVNMLERKRTKITRKERKLASSS